MSNANTNPQVPPALMTLSLHYPVPNREEDQTWALGRNGWTKATGLSLFVADHANAVSFVRMEPYNSRGNISRCALDVPLHADTLQKLGEKFLALADHVRRTQHPQPAPVCA